ncbi:alpha/beta hydrolase [Amycolatopsis sp.]|uniref:alpha/beta hydrolase n=1 Tax=Amycolatopsis sp. TaxID=37632 RepID=UPI002E0227CB|nr:alpha/beta hydrolase [Amycolatopsis sp.]
MKTAVTFPSAGLRLAGHLYTPDDRIGGRRPAIVVSHPMSGVKEQTAGLYAERLARAGFITLAFDAAYQGESEGEPHLLEDPSHRVEDIKSAVTFLILRDEVDAERIGALGICASGGYVIPAVATDHRIKTVATVSAVDTGSMFREGVGRTQAPEVLQAMLDAAGEARVEEARGEPARLQQIHPDTGEQAMSLGQHTYDGWEYYRTPRGSHPRSANHFVFRSIDLIAQFSAFERIELVSPRPLLMIAGTAAATAYLSREAIEKAAEPKELFWIDGATHVDLYDREEYLPTVIAKLDDFFTAGLGAASSAVPLHGLR